MTEGVQVKRYKFPDPDSPWTASNIPYATFVRESELAAANLALQSERDENAMLDRTCKQLGEELAARDAVIAELQTALAKSKRECGEWFQARCDANSRFDTAQAALTAALEREGKWKEALTLAEPYMSLGNWPIEDADHYHMVRRMVRDLLGATS